MAEGEPRARLDAIPGEPDALGAQRAAGKAGLPYLRHAVVGREVLDV